MKEPSVLPLSDPDRLFLDDGLGIPTNSDHSTYLDFFVDDTQGLSGSLHQHSVSSRSLYSSRSNLYDSYSSFGDDDDDDAEAENGIFLSRLLAPKTKEEDDMFLSRLLAPKTVSTDDTSNSNSCMINQEVIFTTTETERSEKNGDSYVNEECGLRSQLEQNSSSKSLNAAFFSRSPEIIGDSDVIDECGLGSQLQKKSSSNCLDSLDAVSTHKSSKKSGDSDVIDESERRSQLKKKSSTKSLVSLDDAAASTHKSSKKIGDSDAIDNGGLGSQLQKKSSSNCLDSLDAASTHKRSKKSSDSHLVDDGGRRSQLKKKSSSNCLDSLDAASTHKSSKKSGDSDLVDDGGRRSQLKKKSSSNCLDSLDAASTHKSSKKSGDSDLVDVGGRQSQLKKKSSSNCLDSLDAASTHKKSQKSGDSDLVDVGGRQSQLKKKSSSNCLDSLDAASTHKKSQKSGDSVLIDEGGRRSHLKKKSSIKSLDAGSTHKRDRSCSKALDTASTHKSSKKSGDSDLVDKGGRRSQLKKKSSTKSLDADSTHKKHRSRPKSVMSSDKDGEKKSQPKNSEKSSSNQPEEDLLSESASNDGTATKLSRRGQFASRRGSYVTNSGRNLVTEDEIMEAFGQSERSWSNEPEGDLLSDSSSNDGTATKLSRRGQFASKRGSYITSSGRNLVSEEEIMEAFGQSWLQDDTDGDDVRLNLHKGDEDIVDRRALRKKKKLSKSNAEERVRQTADDETEVDEATHLNVDAGKEDRLDAAEARAKSEEMTRLQEEEEARALAQEVEQLRERILSQSAVYGRRQKFQAEEEVEVEQLMDQLAERAEAEEEACQNMEREAQAIVAEEIKLMVEDKTQTKAECNQEVEAKAVNDRIQSEVDQYNLEDSRQKAAEEAPREADDEKVLVVGSVKSPKKPSQKITFRAKCQPMS
jgi:hypothetical protein